MTDDISMNKRIEVYIVKGGYCVAVSYGYIFEQYYFKSDSKLAKFLIDYRKGEIV